MLILSLDISTNTGYALLKFEGGQYLSITHGNVVNDQRVDAFGTYPWSYVRAAEKIAREIRAIADLNLPDKIVIEETNKGKNRYTQKILEFIHCCVLKEFSGSQFEGSIVYISTSVWRKQVGIELTKDQKKSNAKLSKAKSKAGGKLTHTQKKELGIKGRVTKKHVAVLAVNARYNMSLKQKDNDIAEAILLGVSYIEGAPHADGK